MYLKSDNYQKGATNSFKTNVLSECENIGALSKTRLNSLLLESKMAKIELINRLFGILNLINRSVVIEAQRKLTNYL